MFKKNKGNTIKRFFPAMPMEILALEEYFEKMSLKGYLLIGGTNSLYEFKKCDPKRRRFRVEFFSKASIFDSKPERKTEEFIDCWQEAGWTHCLSNGQMQCFYAEGDECSEIETDDQLRFQSVVKATLWAQMTSWLVAIFLLVIRTDQGIRMLNSYYGFRRFLTSRLEISLFVFAGFFVIYGIYGFIDFLMFYVRNKKNLSLGRDIVLFDLKKAQKRITFRFGTLMLMMLGLMIATYNQRQVLMFIILTLATLLVVIYLQGKFFQSEISNRRTNIMMTIVIAVGMVQLLTGLAIGSLFIGKSVVFGRNSMSFYSSDDIPITLETLGIYPLEDYAYRESSMNVDKTLFAKEVEFDERYRPPENYKTTDALADNYPYMNVTVFESDNEFIMNRYLGLYIRYKEEAGDLEIDEHLLADYGYTLYIPEKIEGQMIRVLLVSSNRAIDIGCSTELTVNQITLVLNSILSINT